MPAPSLLDSPDDTLSGILQQIHDATSLAQDTVPKFPRKPWISADSWLLIQQLRSLRRLHDNSRHRLRSLRLRLAWRALA
eukprot:9855455-Prorocentrum_lima.AAC.1